MTLKKAAPQHHDLHSLWVALSKALDTLAEHAPEQMHIVRTGSHVVISATLPSAVEKAGHP